MQTIVIVSAIICKNTIGIQIGAQSSCNQSGSRSRSIFLRSTNLLLSCYVLTHNVIMENKLNILSAKYPFGEMSFGKISIRQNVFRQDVFSARCLSARCPSTHFCQRKADCCRTNAYQSFRTDASIFCRTNAESPIVHVLINDLRNEMKIVIFRLIHHGSIL